MTKKFVLIVLICFIYTGCFDHSYDLLEITPPKDNPPDKYSEPFLQIDSEAHMNTIKQLVFSSNGKILVSASHDKTVRLWDIAKGKHIGTIQSQIDDGLNGIIETVAISPNNKLIAISGYPSTYGIRIYNIEKIHRNDYQAERVITGHCYVNKIEFSPDGKYLASAGTDNNVMIWDIETGNEVLKLEGHTDSVNDVNYSPDGNYILTSSDDSTLRLWDSNNGNVISIFKDNRDNIPIMKSNFNSNGKYIYYQRSDNTIIIRQIKPGIVKHFFNILTLGFWEWSPGKKIAQKQFNKPIGAVSISPNKSCLLVSEGSKANILSIPKLSNIGEFNGHYHYIVSASISNNGLVATADAYDHAIKIWNLFNRKDYRYFAGKGRSKFSIGFSKNGKSIAWGNSNEINNIFIHGNLEQTFNLNMIKIGEAFPKYSVGVERNKEYYQGIEKSGNISISTENGYNKGRILKINNTASLTHLPIKSNAVICSATLTHNGKFVIIGGADGVIKSYSVDTGRINREYIGHVGNVWGVAVSPDNQLIASCSSDQLIKLWNLKTGENLLNLFVDNDNQWVAWTSKGFWTSSEQGKQYVYFHINRGPHWNAIVTNSGSLLDCFESKLMIKKTLLHKKTFANSSDCVNEFLSKTKMIVHKCPKIQYTSHDKKKYMVKTNQFFVKAKAFSNSNNEPVNQIWLELNGQKVPDNQVKILMNGNYAELEANLILSQRFNFLSAYASTKEKTSVPEKMEITYMPEEVTEVHNLDSLYLLSIGINHYKRLKQNISFADNDAESIVNLFMKQKKVLYNKTSRLYDKVNANLLTNSNATKANIMNGLKRIKKNASNNSLTIIYIALYLYIENNTFYLCPFDIDNNNIKETAIKADNIFELLDATYSTKILILDLCYKDHISFEHDINFLFNKYANSKRTVVMAVQNKKGASCRYQNNHHSVLSKYLLKAFDKKTINVDADRNNIIEFSELNHFIEKNFQKISYKNIKMHISKDLIDNKEDFQIGIKSD